jgi:predicted DNA-binding transcriptional regulator YafY
MSYPAFVCIDYTNYRGERSTRIIRPLSIKFMSNEWHREPQWLLEAHDLDKDAIRTFAMSHIHSWDQEPNR